MKLWANIFKVILLVIGIVVIAFNAQLYNFCKQQKAQLNSIKDRQDVEAEFNTNKFKYQADQIERLSKDLEDARQQIKDQREGSRDIQTSLIDIKAEADAIKQDMKGWQKDYVSVLAELEKKTDDSRAETKVFENNLMALNIPELKDNINSLKALIEKMNHPQDSSLPAAALKPDKKAE